MDTMEIDVDFDPNELTLEDAEDFEEYTGVPLAEIGELVKPDAAGNATVAPPMKVITAMVWISGRMKDPSFTLAQARATKFGAIKFPAPPAAKAKAGKA